MDLSMTNRHVKVKNLDIVKLSIFSLIVFAQLGCAQHIAEPYFPGLNAGVVLTDSCVQFDGYAINTSEIEGDREFNVYAGKTCDLNKKIFFHRLGVEASLAGVWNEYLVFDEGTDVNGHDLRLIPLNKSSDNFFLFSFEGEPSFSDDTIVFYAPSDIQATALDCKAQAEEFTQWQEFEMEVRIGKKQEFSVKTKTLTPIEGEFICYGLQ